MTEQEVKPKSIDELKQEIQRLEGLLQEEQVLRQEAQETLEAIRTGAVDGIVRSTPEGEQIFILKGSDTPYRNLIEKMDEGALLISESGSILYANIGFAKLVDTPLDKVMGTHVSEWVSARNIEVLNDIITDNLKNGRRVFEIAFQNTRKQLVPTQVSISKIALDSINALALIITDLSKHMQEDVKRYTTDLEKEIAERKKAEEALRQSEERFRLVLKNSPVNVSSQDLNFRYTWIYNPQLGYSLPDVVGKNDYDLLPPETAQIVSELKKKAVLTGKQVREEVSTIHQGSKLFYDFTIEPLQDKSGKITGVNNIVVNITERKKIEEAIKQSEEKYYQLFASMTEMFQVIELIYDENGKAIDYYYREVNPAFEKLVGKSREQLIDKRAKALFGIVEDYWIHQYDNVSKSGNPVHFENYGAELDKWYEIYAWKANDKQVAITFTDVTERKKTTEALEEYQKNLERLVEERTKQIKDSERLAAIGATAGMVGHDIRNPLQAITGDVYLAKTELASTLESDEKNSIKESLAEIEKNIDYINKIVQDLQDYARPLNPNPGEVDLKVIIDKLIQKNGIPKNVKVSIGVEDQARRFVADADYLNRILYNLVTNAVQAMPKGGKLSIIAHKEANEVVIAVKDTGVGIPKEIQGKMFTPMFTTKSKGQGFGLPVVKRMTDSLGGKVSFESEEGKGTTFSVRFAPKELKR